ncbi:alpha/beta fold hydrolase [Arthrobacter zhaoxinii]|uniref:alpha/beta fold hydrolase n=1 Tax=Arthrobacter zhaoxinii TaxID=2964616 RepID=UPI00210795FE|nr:alpha/beta hydrolase [Arthrobacter zhaoxinii]MCQ1999995.1 alpha/beta hydrolase [Arthrobacter zhaoxinii]
MNAQTVIRRNNVRVLGRADGPVLMLVQGFGCDQVIWNPILPAFTDTYKVVLFDHVGTGGADPEAYDPAKYAVLEGYAADLVEILDALDLEQAIIVGHSIAGAMAVAASVQTPRIARLVLLCTAPCYVSDDGYAGGFSEEDIQGVMDAVEANYPLWARMVAPGIAGPDAGPEGEAAMAEQMCRLHPEYVRDFLRMTFATDIRHLLPQVSVPALILQSRADPLTPEAAGLYLHRFLPGSTLAELNVRGSMPHVISPRETVEAILQHLPVVRS